MKVTVLYENGGKEIFVDVSKVEADGGFLKIAHRKDEYGYSEIVLIPEHSIRRVSYKI